MRRDLLSKQELLRMAEKNAADFKRRLDEAVAKLEKRKAAQQSSKSDSAARVSAKRKSKAAEKPKEVPTTSDGASPSPPKRTKTSGPFQNIMDAGIPQLASEPSDDDVPDPDDSASPPAAAPKGDDSYKGLDSILCLYKERKIDPRKSSDITFDLCAEMCSEEMDETAKWTTQQKADRHKMILSALKLVYKDKDPAWFRSAFLQSPSGAHKYWLKVLQRRTALWRETAKKAKMLQLQAGSRARKTTQQRLREKIRKRKLAAGIKAKPVKKASAPTVHVISDSSNSSAEEGTAAAEKAEPESAPDPLSSYTPQEIKSFAKMAKAIRNSDDANGLSSAVADFVDSEFSDNTFVLHQKT